MSENKPVLLFSAGHGNVSLLQELVDYYTLAIFDENLANVFKSMGIACIATRDFVDPEMVEQVKGVMLWEIKKIMDGIIRGDIAFDNEHPLMHSEGLATWFPHYVYDRIVEASVRILAAGKVAEDHRIAGMVVNEDVSAHGKAVTLFGLADGYPTIHLAHANHFIKSGTTDLHCHTTAQHIGAAGEYMKNWYIECGHPEENIKILGAPQWDYLYKKDFLPSREMSRTAFGFSQDALTLTFASTWPQMVSAGGRTWAQSIKVLDDTWDTFVDVAKKMKAQVIVKMHPTGGQGREQYFSESLKTHDLKGAITRDHGAYSISASDCVVLQTSSNFGVEAGIMGVPSVELYTPGSRMPHIPGTWGDDLEDLIVQAIKDGANEEFVRAMNYDNDGEATERTIEWIREHCPVE
jgi:hypothetical protein